MSKFCANCGAKLSHDDTKENKTLVETVNTQLDDNTINNDTQNKDSSSNLLGLISLILIFGVPSVASTISDLFPVGSRDAFLSFLALFPLAGIVLMIIGRVKNPKDKFLKAVMWAVIASIIYLLFLYVLLSMLCYLTCNGVDGTHIKPFGFF